MPNQSKFNALLSFNDVQLHDNNDFNVMRRLTLVSLTKNSEELLKIAQTDEASFLSLFETSVDYVAYLQELLSLAEQSALRMADVVGLTEGDK